MSVRHSRLSTQLRRAPTRYEPTHRLAAGGMAEVWKAIAHFDDARAHTVALKRVLPELASQELYRSMFEDEARLGMRLQHPNIVRIYDAREIGGTFIMVMELVDGTSLKGILDRAHARGARMPVATALWITLALARALDYAHGAEDDHGAPMGIIHRDVSPHNLLVGVDGAVKLADFGLADATVHQTQLGDGMLGGKLGYLAPELIEQRPSTPQVDVFAVGIVLWEMLCGRSLFRRDDDAETVRAVARAEVPPPSSLDPRIPPGVDALVASVLARDPDARMPGAGALVRALEALLREIDPGVSENDIALIVGLHLATDPPPAQTLAQAPAEMFLAELEAFVTSAGPLSAGEAPLDPSLFDRGGPTHRR